MLETSKSLGITHRLFFNVFLLMFAFFIMKFGQFMIVPFLAIYLSNFSLGPLSIGTIIGAGQLSYCITSLCTGDLLDRYNPKHLLIITLFAVGIVYQGLYENQSLICFILLNIVAGVFRAIFDIASKSSLTINMGEQQRNFALGFRYAVLNLAAALGPLCGARYVTDNSTQLFHRIAFCYLFISLLLLILWSRENMSVERPFLKRGSIIDTLQMIKTDHSLKALFLINFMCYGLYSQIASSLAQYITKQFDQGITIYSNLLILNAVICVVLQVFIGHLIRKINYKMLASIGLSLSAIGFVGFCFAQNSMELNYAMLILSMGEVIFFPLNDMLVAKIAPAHLIGRYYGILNASTIGLSIGPILGGAIYQIGSYYLLFLICSLSSLFMIFLYRKLTIFE